MGKGGRVACIFTPYLFTLASLVCLIFVGLGCTNAKSSTLNDLYFIQVNLENLSSAGSKTTTEIENILNQHGITGVSATQVSDLLSQLQGDTNLSDFYSIGLWGYCDGDITANNNYHTTWCSEPKSEFYFNPLKVWGMDNAAVKQELPKDYNKFMKIYRVVCKWMFIAYIVAFVTTCLEILLGFFAVCSRWGSCVTTLFSLLALLFTTAASVTATILFSTMKSSVGNALKPYGMTFSMGRNMFAATWLAVVFSLAALLFWTFSVCCCSGRSPYNHRARDRGSLIPEKAPYTYEPLGAGAAHQTPYGHQQNTSYPGHVPNEYPMTNTTHGPQHAYEPFRHV